MVPGRDASVTWRLAEMRGPFAQQLRTVTVRRLRLHYQQSAKLWSSALPQSSPPLARSGQAKGGSRASTLRSTAGSPKASTRSILKEAKNLLGTVCRT